MPRPGPAWPLLVLAALGVVVNEAAGRGGHVKNTVVHGFGAREPGYVELWTKVIRRKQLPTKGRLDTVRYPTAGGDSNNILTYVAVTVPQRTFTKDEVRVTDGGPGMKYVVLSVGGRRSFRVDFAVTVYGHEPDSGATAKDRKAATTTEAAQDKQDDDSASSTTDMAEEQSN